MNKPKRRRPPFMNHQAYEVVAGVVNELPDSIRQDVADHFARAFTKRSNRFDPVAWATRTGGIADRAHLHTESDQQREARVMAYAEQRLREGKVT